MFTYAISKLLLFSIVQTCTEKYLISGESAVVNMLVRIIFLIKTWAYKTKDVAKENDNDRTLDLNFLSNFG